MAGAERPVLLYSIGKDSSVLLHLAHLLVPIERPPLGPQGATAGTLVDLQHALAPGKRTKVQIVKALRKHDHLLKQDSVKRIGLFGSYARGKQTPSRLEAPMTEFAAVPKRRLGPPFRTPEGQSASFVELFFDLVFVFAVTQVTAQTVEHLDWEGAARALLIFWMIWWAWTQWTWALNPADTEHAGVRATTLVVTAVAFVMAVSVGQAFEGDGGVWFGVSYVAVRTMGLWLYLAVASDHKKEFAAVQRFALASVPGMVAFVAGGFAGDEARAWFWLAGVVLDIGAAMFAGSQADWRLHAGHFAERHGLFVIIALGESLIVVGTIAAGAEKTAGLVSVSIGAIVVACLLWWTYFGWLKDALERRFENEPSASHGQFARDTFSLLHFPLIGGVIGIAIGFEEMVRHPDHHLETAGMVALAGGLVLFVGAAVAVWARATRQLLAPRLVILTVLVVALALAADAQPALVLTIIAVALVAIVAVEEVQTPGREACQSAGA